MPLNGKQTKQEKELRRRAGIAVRMLGYESLRQYELDMYREAVEQAQKIKSLERKTASK